MSESTELWFSFRKSEGFQSILPYLATVSLILFTAMQLVQKTSVTSVQTLYDSWIARARRERDAKYHKVLLKESSPMPHDEMTKWQACTAWQIRRAVLEKKLYLPSYVASLAMFCRTHGRKEEGMNAIAEEFYDDAHQAAKACQAAVVSKTISSRNAPPLHGVPISVKESSVLQGAYATCGLACRLHQRSDKDSLTVQVLKNQGAIPMCTGNVTQIMMLPESYNRIWGVSRNPWNLERCVGGSSGGDGALVASGCVHMAVASDVAGSIRIPASFNGVVGFKPSFGRSSTKGGARARKSGRVNTAIAIPTVSGPITKTVEDAALFCKAYWVPELFRGDLMTTPLPFDDAAYSSTDKLTIGYFDTDGWVEPCRTSKRAIRETIDGLKKEGHTCVPFTLPRDGWFSYGLLVAINAAEGSFRSYVEALEGEQIWDEYNTLLTAATLPDFIRWFLVHFVLDKRRSHLLNQTRRNGKSAQHLGELMCDLQMLRAEWEDLFQKGSFDAVIFPAMPIPAFKHNTSGKLTSTVSYMFLANLLLWPSGVVPVTTIREDEACYPADDLPESQHDKIAELIAENMEGSSGMPIGVSVMCPLNQDEKCLRVMKEVERVVGFTETPNAFLQSQKM